MHAHTLHVHGHEYIWQKKYLARLPPALSLHLSAADVHRSGARMSSRPTKGATEAVHIHPDPDEYIYMYTHPHKPISHGSCQSESNLDCRHMTRYQLCLHANACTKYEGSNWMHYSRPESTLSNVLGGGTAGHLFSLPQQYKLTTMCLTALHQLCTSTNCQGTWMFIVMISSGGKGLQGPSLN